MPTDVNKPTLAQSPYSADGLQINVPSTAIDAATAVYLHAASSDPGVWHVVTFECSNLDTSERQLWICWGGSTTAHMSVHTVPASSTIVVIDRRRVRSMTITAFEPSGSGLLNVYPQADVLSDAA